MDQARRRFTTALGLAGAGLSLACHSAIAAETVAGGDELASLSAEVRAFHERCMRLAIEQARKNRLYPFGAVIVRTGTGEVLARGANAAGDNPILHGEIAAMNDYVQRHGNHGWEGAALYTTGEPCPMCMSALAWAGLRQVVWATSIAGIRRAGIPQIEIGAREVAAKAASFYTPTLLLGGVLAHETDRLFAERQRAG